MVAQVLKTGADPEVHELATLFPPMTPDDPKALKADIKDNGLRDQIIVDEGRVVDGVHRLRACREQAIEYQLVEWGGPGSLLALVAGRNLHRRDFSKSQRGMLAARIAAMLWGRPANDARGRAVSQAEVPLSGIVGRTSVQQARKA